MMPMSSIPAKKLATEHFFEQVADECQHEDAYDEYHDEAQHGGELLARTEPSAYRPAEAHGEEDAQHESRDAARLYDEAFAPSGHGGDEEQDEQYDVERIHVVSFAMGLCHESSKKIATFNAVWNGRGFTGRVPAGGIPPFAGLRACRTFI